MGSGKVSQGMPVRMVRQKRGDYYPNSNSKLKLEVGGKRKYQVSNSNSK